MPIAAKTRPNAREQLRDRIKRVATKQFILFGYRGVSYLDLAKQLKITHSNIHYYFNTKADLATAVLEDFATETLDDNRAIWTDPETTLRAKFIRARDRYYRMYLRFNPKGEGYAPWALLSRFSADTDILSSDMKWRIKTTLQELDAQISEGLRLAVDNGELVEDTPIDGLTVQIASVFYLASQSTKYDNGFRRFDLLLKTTSDCIAVAYGKGGMPSPWPRPKKPRRKSRG